MYVLALSDYKMFKACCCRGLQTRPPIRQINCSLLSFRCLQRVEHEHADSHGADATGDWGNG